MKRSIFTLMMIICLFLTTACNTMSGIGRDIEQAGDAIENAANKNKTY